MGGELMETTVHIDRVEITVHAPDKPLFLTVERAADEVGQSVSHMRKLIREGKLPSYKGDGTGGRVHVKTVDLIAFMELRRVACPNQPPNPTFQQR
ncbi:MAG: hypothetical protein CME15_11505 [Gemmatimonadetes bacterium]|jgi:excisionase family DNA binding protein|nr:hypothetical protein [Gemmatimonadota bacterium]